MGLGRLPPVFPALLQRGRPGSGHYLLERATRPGLLLFANFFAGEERHDLDDLELSALVRPETDAALPDQSPAARSIVLATISKPPPISPAQQCRCWRDRRAGRGTHPNRDGKRFAR